MVIYIRDLQRSGIQSLQIESPGHQELFSIFLKAIIGNTISQVAKKRSKKKWQSTLYPIHFWQTPEEIFFCCRVIFQDTPSMKIPPGTPNNSTSFFYGCFNWMIPNHYHGKLVGNHHFHPFKKKWVV